MLVFFDHLSEYHTKASLIQSNLISLLERELPEAVPPDKVAITQSTFEELNAMLCEQSMHMQDFGSYLADLKSSLSVGFSLFSQLREFRSDLLSFKQESVVHFKYFASSLSQLSKVLENYKERCRSTYLQSLKNVDLDLRRILKPLVPSDVVNEQVNFPLINSMSTLKSSMLSKKSDTSVHEHEETQIDHMQQLNEHNQMLINTLESVARDLIMVLAETNKSYYDIAGDLVNSRAPTPLGAPLPDYFCYEPDITEEEHILGTVTGKAKERWKEKIKKLEGQIRPQHARHIIRKIDHLKEGEDVDLEAMFKSIDLPLHTRELIAFSMANSSKIIVKDVSLKSLIRGSEKKKSFNKELLKPKSPALKTEPSEPKQVFKVRERRKPSRDRCVRVRSATPGGRSARRTHAI